MRVWNNTLTLIRGLPGSGKTTLARSMVKADPNGTVYYEADMYFTGDHTTGFKYQFDASKLHIAHMECQQKTEARIKTGWNVVVSNTFSTLREMQSYMHLSKVYSAKLQIIECHGNFGSIHDVPAETIEKMRERWFNMNSFTLE